MGREELARSLKAKGEEEVRTIWRQAEAEAERYRDEKRRDVARRREQRDLESEESASRECLQITARVERTIRRRRLQVQLELDRRLKRLARDELGGIDPAARRQCLVALAKGVPAGDWRRVRVHPGDRELATGTFPDLVTESDDTLAGGFILEAEDAAIRIDNSLGGRLETVWTELCGRLIAELEEEADAGPAGTAA